ncbi:complement C1r-A subcomponent-like [Tachysurus vachellii]|uniref:complement C1r-A subcomponent-like n=1 Tax=Tachysurus vachellii TaxID=175792 RepID=UPI00296AD3E2|nr:complement C1r-A subcomponent-like [Tachysurus vachellii]
MELQLNIKWIFIISINLQIWSFVYMSVMYGELHSPNYPEHYPAPLYKHWDLEVPLGYHIQINFNYLNIKPSQGCRNESLTISYKEKVMKYCGDQDSKSHSHPGNSSIFIPTAKVKLSLCTNEVNQGPTLPVGFSAFYQAKDRDECSSQVPPCTQICLNTMGSYLCACYHGFKLDADQRTCVREFYTKQDFKTSDPDRDSTSFNNTVYILTSHMITTHAYAGHNNLNEMEKYITLNISSIHIHEIYTTEFDNDIALIKLKSPITFSENIRPVCLPPKPAEWKKYTGLVSGYGLIDDETGGFQVADELMYVDVPSVDQHTCRASFEKERRINNQIPHVTDNMFCAGLSGGGKDSCFGDSGSAFVVREKDVYSAVGIVSWGLHLCGSQGTYGVYTKVSQYLDWINKTMSEN